MDIISLILFLLLISSGSIFATSYFDKKYEEVLPITCCGIIVISFLFGLVGLLKYSTVVISIICLVLFVLGIVKAIKNKNNICKKIFTPAFFVFIVLICFMFLGVYNKVINIVDEYSHWGDIVKVMTLKDILGTNHEAHVLFGSYPPAMSLFQYTLQEINCFISNESYCEWLAYIAYDILAICFVLPVCSKFDKNKVYSYVCYAIILITLPFAFYLSSYFSLYIDAFLSFLIGAGLIELLWHEKEDVWFDLRMYSIMFTLTLAKDTGLLFAVILLAGFVVEHLIQNKNNILSIIVGTIFIGLPKLLWSLSIKLNNVSVAFGNKISLTGIINVLTGKDDSYRPKVLKNYITELVTTGKEIGNTTIRINYALLAAVSIIAICLLVDIINKKKMAENKNCLVAKYSAIACLVIFIVGMCIIYMFKFTEEEALGLASLDRYLSIVYFGIWLFIVMSLVIFANKLDCNKIICLLLICFSLTCTSLETIVTFASNAFSKASIAIRNMYTEDVDKAMKYLDGDSKVWFIKQYSDNEDSLAFNYLIRPNYVVGPWSIGTPDEGDGYTVKMNAEEWKKQLIEGNYDFVYLYDVNGVFRDNFAECFSENIEIEDKTIYRVDHNTGLLYLCE